LGQDPLAVDEHAVQAASGPEAFDDQGDIRQVGRHGQWLKGGHDSGSQVSEKPRNDSIPEVSERRSMQSNTSFSDIHALLI
jgi:hypothetical protein